MKGLNPRHQNLLPICPESEYNNQNGNFDPQSSIDAIALIPAYGNHLLSMKISN